MIEQQKCLIILPTIPNSKKVHHCTFDRVQGVWGGIQKFFADDALYFWYECNQRPLNATNLLGQTCKIVILYNLNKKMVMEAMKAVSLHGIRCSWFQELKHLALKVFITAYFYCLSLHKTISSLHKLLSLRYAPDILGKIKFH